MSENYVQFCFGIHNHQPVGNFGWVFEESTEKSYLPFLDVLAEFPSVKTSIHTSGPLIEWIEEHHPQYIDRLGALVDRGQVEILGGGFYEPILTMLSRDDALEQIDLMKSWSKSRFGADIRGIWLTERIWDPSLPELLTQAGIEFTICDTTHFQWAGLPLEDIQGYYITDKLGKTVAIFPIDRKLRYTIPFHDPEETRNRLLELGEKTPGRLITYADDGEKFGVWPGTYNLVFEREWLRRFFTDITSYADQIRFKHFSEALDTNRPSGRVILPTASYLEMTEWALPSTAGANLKKLVDDIKTGPEWPRFEPFLRGGFWDNFLVKYPESNRMHKKMLRVSEKVRAMRKSVKKDQALTALFRGQCNCAYWHGMFGGLYLNYLRDAVTRTLLEAEVLADGKDHLRLDLVDFNADGTRDAILENDYFNIVVSPVLGGAVSLAELRRQNFAVSFVLTRRMEAYHEAVRNLKESAEEEDGQAVSIHDRVSVKEEGLSNYLIFDRAQRLNFQDHFLPPNAGPESLIYGGHYGPNDFLEGDYRITDSGQSKDTIFATLQCTGAIPMENGDSELNIEKRYELKKGLPVLTLTQTFTAGEKAIHTRWAPEFNLTLLTKDAPDRTFTTAKGEHPLDKTVAVDNANGFTLTDGWQKFELTVQVDKPADLWAFPIETVSQSESGYERTYQGTSFAFVTELEIPVGQTISIKITWNLKEVIS